MDQLDVDFHVLTEDFEKVLALESLGTHPNDPAFRAVRKRWVIGEAPGEHLIKGAGAVAGRATKDGLSVLNGAAGVVSKKMLWTFKDWIKERHGQASTHLAANLDKSNRLKKKARKLQEKVHELDSLPTHQIPTGAWTSKICVEDNVDIEACINFSSKEGKTLESVSDSYIVFTKAGTKTPKKLDEASGKLKTLGRSTGWAVKRAAGLLGSIKGTDVKAFAIPGNVVAVVRHYDTKNEVVDYAIARDGSYGPAIPSLSLEQCKDALSSVIDIAASLHDRGTVRKGLGYGGIEEAANPKGSYFGSDMSTKEIYNITRAIKNANTIENALVAAQVRVAEGLLVMVEQSIKKQK